MTKAYPHVLDDEDILFFLHIPKTAGTSLTQTLTQRLGRRATLTPEQLNQAKLQPKEVLENARFVYGHFNRTVCTRRMPEAPNFTITFLRDPINHYLSIYKHLQRDPNFSFTTRITLGDRDLSHYIHKITSSGNLGEFLAAPESKLFDNYQTRYLVDGMRFLPDLNRQDLLNEALVCLEELGAFGITDRYNESLLLFNQALNLAEPLSAVSVNAAPNKEIDKRVSQSEKDEILKRTTLDHQLYQRASALFEERLSRL